MSVGTRSLSAEVRRLWELAWATPGFGTGFTIGVALVIGGAVDTVFSSGRGLFAVGGGIAAPLLSVANSINADGNYGRGTEQVPPPDAPSTGGGPIASGGDLGDGD